MSKTGRFYVTVKGRTFCVEPIHPKSKVKWGDLNPATGKVEGQYGNKYPGSICEEESIITPENGFKNIQYTEVGGSPLALINKLVSQQGD